MKAKKTNNETHNTMPHLQLRTFFPELKIPTLFENRITIPKGHERPKITLDRSPLEIRVTENQTTILCGSSCQHITLYCKTFKD